jgi:HPt (histidine-containing phosphotransfer) domain-containing protein
MGEDHIAVKIDRDLEDLIPGYLKRRQEDIAAIRSACDAGDFENIRILGHSMKGSGGGYGFDRITEIGKLIEESSKNKDTASILAHTDELADYLSRIEIVYE